MNLEALKSLLIKHEGERLSPYRCTSGFLTLGVGHNLDAKPISQRASRIILEDDIQDVIEELDRHLPWWKSLDDVRQLVLADMCFNLGIVSFLKFKNTLKAVEEGRYKDAAKGMGSSLWATQVGNRATRLIQMMETGQWDG